MIKFALKIILNSVALYIAGRYFSGFILTGGLKTVLTGAIVLTLLYTFVRPLLKLVSFPLIWLTLGLFNLVIAMFLLLLADKLLPQLTVANLQTLFWVSLLTALANIF